MSKAIRSLMLASAVLGLLLMAVSVQAQEEASSEPQEWWYKNIVDVDYVLQYAKMPRAEDVLIIDSRPYETKFINGFIPTAVSIPFSKFEEMKGQLPENKDALLIFYCGGFDCKLSHNSAKAAEALGYTNIQVFAAGFPEFKKAAPYYSVGVEYVKNKLVENEPYLLVDARPANKYLEGQIPSSINIPFSAFEERTGLLPADKNTELIYYCGGYDCKLSHNSALAAIELGYTNVKVAEAGYPGWVELYGAGSSVALEGDIEGSIDLDFFTKSMENGFTDIYLYDVRDQDEWDAGHVENSVHMPVSKLEKEIGTLPTDKPIVFICTTGARSGEAFYMFMDMRPEVEDVFYVEAGVEFHSDGTLTITPPAQ